MRRTWTITTAMCTAGALAVTVTGPVSAAPVPAGSTQAGLVAGVTATAATGGMPLNVRSGPAVAHPRTATVPDRRRLAVVCQVRGQEIAGHAARTDVWNRLSTGRYVSDAYVAWRPGRPAPRWCAAPGAAWRTAPQPVAVAHTGGIPLNLRAGPAATQPRAGTVRDGARLAVVCQVRGQEITGRVRRTDLWDRLPTGRYVSDAYLSWPSGRPALPTCGTASPPRSSPDAVAPNPAAFIARMAPAARDSMRRYGVPASVAIAQAILESGWGRSQLAYGDHNYFGIKCFGGPGPVAVGCRAYPTSECVQRRCFATRATFRVYARLADSVRDHGRFLAVDNPRYRPAFAHRRSADRFTAEIHRAGYATSPGYSRAIISLMRQYDLYRFDR